MGGFALLHDAAVKIALDCWDAALHGKFSYILRRDAEDTMTHKITEKVAIVRADVHDEVMRLQGKKGDAFLIEFSEIIPQDFCGAACIRVGSGKQDACVNDEAKLDQLAGRAGEYLGRITGLLMGSLPDGMHFIDRRKVAKK
jgi:hypothetical protein